MDASYRRVLAAATLAILAGLAAASAVLGQERARIIITDTLDPARLEVSAGATVTWRNEDDERHRIRSRDGPVEFDSGNLEPGERFSVTLVVAGEYRYLDARDDEDSAYFGTIVVGEPEPSGEAPAMAGTVTLIDESFQPPSLEVAVGATVTWQNIDGDDDHTVTSTEGAFDSGVLPAGTSFEHVFDTPGVFPYMCAIHPEMQGSITVVGEGPAPSAGTTDPSPAAIPLASPAAAASPESDPSMPFQPAAVSIVDLSFDPGLLEVAAGTTVTWTNEDALPHTVTASEADFDSGVLMAGDTFSQRFETPGTYDYLCAIHPSMRGTVVVAETEPTATAGLPAGEPSPAASPPPTTSSTAVSIVNVSFEPPSLEVAPGSTVEWRNDDPFDHTVTATDGAFDSGPLGAGATYALTFDEPGVFTYLCAIHPTMTGTVTVVESG